jgi:hypothetical protein
MLACKKARRTATVHRLHVSAHQQTAQDPQDITLRQTPAKPGPRYLISSRFGFVQVRSGSSQHHHQLSCRANNSRKSSHIVSITDTSYLALQTLLSLQVLHTSAFMPLQFPTSSLLLCLFLKLHPRTSTNHTAVQDTLTTNRHAQLTHANTSTDRPSPMNKLTASPSPLASPVKLLMSAVNIIAATNAEIAASWAKKRFV